MKVLMITGDKNVLTPGKGAYERLQLQKAQVEKLEVVYWGRGALLAPLKIREHFDVVTAQDPFWRGIVGWVVARRLRARLNIQVHADLSGQSFVRHILAQIVLRHADSVRVVSEKIRKQVEHVGVRASIHVLPVFTDVTKFQNLQKKPHPRFTKVILWIGRFEPEKNPGEALEVLKEVRAKGLDADLIYLGSGSLESTLRVRAVPLADYVEFVGWQDPVPYLSMADVVLSTSHHESYGASIVEALAASVPVVSYDVGVAREAGALIAEQGGLAEATASALQSDTRGNLKLPLLSKQEWSEAWKKTL